MIGLLRAELLRLRSRRAIQLMVIGLALLLLFIVGGVFLNSAGEAPSPETIQQARESLDDLRRQCEQEEIECGPEVDELQVEDFYDDQRFILGQDAEAPLMVYAVFVTIVAFAAGASFLGSEQHHNTVGHLLLWEPRRGRVLLAKAAAAALATAVAGFALLLMLYLGLFLVAATRGVTSAPPGFFLDTLGMIGRVSLLVGGGAILGLALTSLLRSTAAAVGFGIAYLAALERFLSFLRPTWRPWMAGDLAATVLAGENRLYIPSEGLAEPKLVLIDATRGLLVLGAYVAVLLAIAILEFRRRDVT